MSRTQIIFIVIAVYMLVLLVLGYITSKRVKNTSDFLSAGRSLNIVMTTCTLVAVQIGAGVVLGGSSMAAGYGIWPGMWYGIGCGGGLILAGIFVAKKLKSATSYVPLDFYEERYGEKNNRKIRLWNWFCNVPGQIGIFTSQLIACGALLSGFGYDYKISVLVCALIILVYASLSGMLGVATADSFQVAIIIIGIPICAYAVLKGVIAADLGTFRDLINTPFIPSGMGTKAIFIIVPFLFSISVSYDAFMRYQTAKDSETAAKGCIYSGVIVIFISFLVGIIGAGGILIYPNVSTGAIFSTVVINNMHPVFSGIVIAAVLAAAMSSGSCMLMGMSACFSRDLYNKFLNPDKEIDELPYSNIIARTSVVIGTIVGVLIAYNLTEILDTIILFTNPGMGSLLIPLLGGALWSGGNRKGAEAAMIVGGIIGTISFIFGIPSPWKGLINVDLGLAIAYISSAIVYIIVSRKYSKDKEILEEIKNLKFKS